MEEEKNHKQEKEEIVDLGKIAKGFYGRRTVDENGLGVTRVYQISDADPSVPMPKNQTESVEQARQEFFAKNRYIESQRIIDLVEIESTEFIQLLFERNVGQYQNVEPMECVESLEYTMWKKQKEKKRRGEITKIDYTGYACWRYNPLIFYIDGKKTIKRKDGTTKEVKNCKHYVVLKDDDNLQAFIAGRQFALISPLTYVGRNNTYDNARYLYAFAFDLDGVWESQIEKLFCFMLDGTIPMANIITSSGHGLHLWYLLEEPVPMFKQNKELLNKMKRGLTNVIWNPVTSMDQAKQYQGVTQGFRMPGTLTKFGEKIRSWQNLDAPMHSIEELNEHLCNFKLTDKELKQLKEREPSYNPTTVTREEAQRRWPEWYVAKVLKKNTVMKPWNVKRDVYDWWLNRLKNAKYGKDSEIKLHHRYWCILTLVVYGVKCRIPREEVLADGYSLVEKLDSFSDRETNRFSFEDVDDAMRAYDANYNTWPLNEIEKTTLITIKRNRRNGKKQEDHIKIMNYIRDNIVRKDGNWRGKGRKQGTHLDELMSVPAQKVAVWRFYNSKIKNKSLCGRVMKISRPTVDKWWNAQLNPDVLKMVDWRKEHPTSSDIYECERETNLTKGIIRKWWNIPLPN